MNARDAHYAASGLAYIEGVENFSDVLPLKRAESLLKACLETRGAKWVERNFVRYLVHVAHRSAHMPACENGCPYRCDPPSLPLQQNALRVEIITPSPRCGARLRYGRSGGHYDDYLPCTFHNRTEQRP
jgi:hypothetical protein